MRSQRIEYVVRSLCIRLLLWFLHRNRYESCHHMTVQRAMRFHPLFRDIDIYSLSLALCTFFLLHCLPARHLVSQNISMEIVELSLYEQMAHSFQLRSNQNESHEQDPTQL